MRRFIASLLLTLGVLTDVVGSVHPRHEPGIDPDPPYSSVERRAIQPHNPTLPECQDDLSPFALITLDVFTVQGHFEPFYAFLIIDLRSGDAIYVIAPENAYRAIFRGIQSPTGLESVRALLQDYVKFLQNDPKGRPGSFGLIGRATQVTMSPEEAKYILQAFSKVEFVDENNLSAAEKADADKNFSSMGKRARYRAYAFTSNRYRARVVLANMMSGKLLGEVVKDYYETFTVLNPVHFTAEKGYLIGQTLESGLSGNGYDVVHPVTKRKTSLKKETTDLAVYLALVGAMQKGMKIRADLKRMPKINPVPKNQQTTTLYRAVMSEELANIKKTGKFINKGYAEGKYFTTSAEAATAYARKAVTKFKDPAYTLVKTEVPTSSLPKPVSVDGGIPAYVLPNNQLPSLIPKVLDTMPVVGN